ncbi:hypothetical protein FH972_023049 [Carpinus fangiana]|uniref:COP9 signalosome complex subunit 3 n=1 Tax=Carpinus fangiana TaxID=176857 RepID=A0A5N6KUH1_9ROSI|nr:hypothetical protein FH972_023049 [Carpinus fangiana]
MALHAFPLQDVLLEHQRYNETRDLDQWQDNDAHLQRVARSFNQLSTEKLGAEYSPDPLEVLNVERETLPYLLILSARVTLAFKKSKSSFPENLRPGNTLWLQAVAVLTHGDPIEARYGEDCWRTLAKAVAQGAVTASTETHPPSASISVVAAAILRMDPSGGTLTTSHLDLVRACLLTHSYAQARPVLDCEVHSFPSPSSVNNELPLSAKHHTSNTYIAVRNKLTEPLTLTDILEYYLCGAMIYIGLDQWARALDSLDFVLCTPSGSQNTAHELMLEAYKKWVLTSLLAHGRPIPLPQTAGGAPMRTVRALAKEYEAVAEAFRGTDGKKLEAEAYEAQEEFRNAGNEGLVRNVVARHRQLAISKLANTYAVVPFSMVAKLLSISDSDAAQYVQRLVQEGLLQASIEQAEGQSVLRFGEKQGQESEQQLKAELLRQTKRIKELSRYIAEADRRLGLSRDYVEHVSRQRKQKTATQDVPDQEEAMDMSFGGAASEEDEESVMADVS